MTAPPPLPSLLPAACAALLAATSAPAARAETDPAAFRKYLSSDAFRAQLAKAWANVPAAILPACPSLSRGEARAAPRQNVTFDAAGQPVSGSWWAHLPVSGCGAARIINILFLAGRAGVRSMVALPGTTRADIALQRDALTYAFIGAGTRAGDCKDMLVTDTAFDGFAPSPGAGRGAGDGPWQETWRETWRETWTVAACGHTFAVPLEFVPDATGTTINQRPAEIREMGK